MGFLVLRLTAVKPADCLAWHAMCGKVLQAREPAI